ncbi:hypothetical protein HK098_003155 [Nowakowskiella sp. JEL0407]|nr:hypothetical protein HK098_003155 [Nowakowskiella sp. JEL0407]
MKLLPGEQIELEGRTQEAQYQFDFPAAILRSVVESVNEDFQYSVQVADSVYVLESDGVDNYVRKRKHNCGPGWEVLQSLTDLSKLSDIKRVTESFVGKKLDKGVSSKDFTSYCWDKNEAPEDIRKLLNAAYVEGFADGTIFGAIGGVSLVAGYGVMAGVATALTPAATLFGSTTLGSIAVGTGLIAAPAAPVVLPFLAGTAAMGFLFYGGKKFAEREKIRDDKK